MSNFLANVARRGAGIAPRHEDESTAAVKPLVTPVWREFASRPAHDQIEEHLGSALKEGADIHRPVEGVVAPVPTLQLPNPTALIDPPRETKPAAILNHAVPADTKVRTLASEPVILNMYSHAAESSDHPVNTGLEDSIERSSGDHETLRTVARPIVNVPLATPNEVPKSRQSPGSLAAKKPAESKLQALTIAAPNGVLLAPRSDTGQRHEVKVAANPVAQEQRVALAPAINVLPQPRRDAPQSGSADHARAEQSQIVVKIGKVEVSASQAQRPVRASRPRGSSGFAEMALRRAYLDRNYR